MLICLKGCYNIKIRDCDLLVKSIIVLYIGIYALNRKVNPFITITFILMYFIAIFLIEIVKKEYVKFIYMYQIIISILVAVKYIDMAALLITITIYDLLIYQYNKKYMAAILGVIPLLTISKVELIESVFLAIMIYIYLILSSTSNMKICSLEKKIEDQRKSIYGLKEKLNGEKNYRSQILYTVKLEERNRISGNLHDKIGHTISGAILQLEAVKVILSKDFAKGELYLDNVIENLRNGMDEIRMTLRNIKPVQEELSINQIKVVLDEKTKNTNYKYSISFDGELAEIGPSIWALFIDAVKEISTNSIKYAEGDFIAVNISILKGFIKMEIKDNGIGSHKIIKGMGLSNLEERVAESKGTVILDGSNGFSVIILIPINRRG